MKKGFRFKVLFLFLPKMNLTQEILCSHLGALKSYQFKEMDNKTFGSCYSLFKGTSYKNYWWLPLQTFNNITNCTYDKKSVLESHSF